MNDSGDRENKLRSLGQLISERFRTEIKEAYDQLVEFDGLYEDGLELVKIDSTTALRASDHSPMLKYGAKKYPLFSHLYWIDSSGKQRVKWTTKDKNSPKIDVKQREYFKTVYYNNEWNLYNDSDSIQFGFESIYSWNSGKALVGVSKKSHSIIQNESTSKIDTMPVIALATAFYSVIDPILPEGYGFAIIDESADVLFHSDKNKNLQENFLIESEENSKLRSVMYARRDECFKIKYSGEQHGIYITPVADLPLFVIAFKKLTKERSVHAQIMNFTFILIVGYFLSFAFMAFITRILKKSESKLKRTSYIFGWIMPRKYWEQIYFNAFFMHVLTIILMVLFLIISEHEVHKILILISASIYSFLYTFLGLNGFTGKRFFSKENTPYLITTALIFIVLSTISSNLGYGWLILFQVILFLFYHINFGKLINVE
ncbi:MAG: hypothetical protein KAI29_17525, partial [Cyclobacteriaceae bacterium]|nr:hypothetical protein [Cyclobacteriaceae bacterium]